MDVTLASMELTVGTKRRAGSPSLHWRPWLPGNAPRLETSEAGCFPRAEKVSFAVSRFRKHSYVIRMSYGPGSNLRMDGGMAPGHQVWTRVDPGD